MMQSTERVSFLFFLIYPTQGVNIPHTPAQTAHHSASKQVLSCLCQVEVEGVEEAPTEATIMITTAMDKEMALIEITIIITVTTIIITIATKVRHDSLCLPFCSSADYLHSMNISIHCSLSLIHILSPEKISPNSGFTSHPNLLLSVTVSVSPFNVILF